MSLALRLAVLLALLAGCAPRAPSEPFVDSRTPPGLPGRFMAPEGWAWGVIQVGDAPGQRYGVSSPASVPTGQVVVVPAYGDAAEAWFETVRDLNAAGLTVWVLDRAGQGGSGRFTSPRDLGHVPSFEPDVRSLEAFVRQVVHAPADQRVTILAHGDGAVVALLALENRLDVDGLVLEAPRTARPKDVQVVSGLAAWLRLDARPPPGWRPWTRRDRPLDRAQVLAAWQLVNPDLRMAGPSLGWRRAFFEASRSALAGASTVKVPTIASGAEEGPSPCPVLAACRLISPARRSTAPHRAEDADRTPWLAQVAAFAHTGAMEAPHGS